MGTKKIIIVVIKTVKIYAVGENFKTINLSKTLVHSSYAPTTLIRGAEVFVAGKVYRRFGGERRYHSIHSGDHHPGNMFVKSRR